jgi:hypothetical protein
MQVATNALLDGGSSGLQYLPYDTALSGNGKTASDGNSRRRVSAQESANALVSTEYYSKDELKLTYSNKDGDSVELNFQHIEYQKATISSQGSEDSAQWEDMVDFIKKEFERLQGEIINKFMAFINGDQPAKDTEDVEKPAGIPGLPEYWNAENTSQRIVDFAVSFFGMYEGNGSDYFETMKSAIEEGFKQASDILGNLPDEVSGLVGDTYDLVMKKLDDWATQQGINTTEEQSMASGAA